MSLILNLVQLQKQLCSRNGCFFRVPLNEEIYGFGIFHECAETADNESLETLITFLQQIKQHIHTFYV